MTEQEWQDELARLRAEVAGLKPYDEKTRADLGRLIADIEHHLARQDETEHHEALLGLLTENVERFEAEHPQLTLVLNQIMLKLSSMGI